MVKKEIKAIITTGKRKDSKARAIIEAGKGSVTVDSVPIEAWSSELNRMKAREPLILAGDLANKVHIRVTARGGGASGQAEAVRMSIARALVSFSKSEDLRKKYVEYDKNMLAFDFRRNEPHHGHGASKRGSRRHKQRSKR